MNIMSTKEPEIISIPAANRAAESGMPVADNAYVMNYESTSIAVKNLGNRLEISAPQTAGYSDHAIFDGVMYVVSKIHLISLSKHTYKTSVDIGQAFSKTTCGRAVGELVIFHRPANMPNASASAAYKPLIVYMPMYQSDAQTPASGTIQSVVDLAGKHAPAINESAPIHMPRAVNAFNLNKLLPAEPYVFYETGDAKHVVFPYQYGIPIREHAADILRDIVHPIANPVDEPATLFWNALPASTKSRCERRVCRQKPVRYRGPILDSSDPDAQPMDNSAKHSSVRIDGFATGTFADAMDVVWGVVVRTGIGLGVGVALMVVFAAIYSLIVYGTLDNISLTGIVDSMRAFGSRSIQDPATASAHPPADAPTNSKAAI